ncbi:GatB/YqeY domain-containing protein [bacterium]|nr:GatB/YqeY domain-containing protein [bacterium]
MGVKADLKSAMKDAMKAKDKRALETIRALLSALQYEEMKQKNEDLPESEVLAVLKGERKKLGETKEFAEKDNRTEAIDEINAQIAVIDRFLPSQLDEAALRRIITELPEEKRANVGMIMKHLQSTHAGEYDGKLASQVARDVTAQ